MKRLIFIFCLCMAFLSGSRAQSKIPQTFSYQAVARGADGKVLANQTIGIKVEILQGSASGSSVYSETHQATSTATGAVNLLIGGGSSKGNISAIDWGSDTFFLKLSMDAEGGTDYQEVSTTQMMPVPYALYAERAGNMGSSENSTPKFTFSVTDLNNTSDDLYCILSGKLESDDKSINLECTLLYLDGKDQELTISIEGLTPSTNNIGQSCSAGRMFYMSYSDVSDGDYKLVVSDKSNKTIKEYPFSFKMIESK